MLISEAIEEVLNKLCFGVPRTKFAEMYVRQGLTERSCHRKASASSRVWVRSVQLGSV